MYNSCPNCGAVTPPEARFCRQCGALLGVSTGAVGPLNNSAASPSTVPFSDNGRTTDPFAADDPPDQKHTSDTTKVTTAEMGHPPPVRTQTEGTYDPEATIVQRPAQGNRGALPAGPQTFEPTPAPDASRFNTSVLSAPAGPTVEAPVSDDDDERTVVAPASRPVGSPSTPAGASTHIAPPQVHKTKANRRWWPVAVAVSLLIAVPVLWFAMRLTRGPASSQTNSAPVAVTDPKQLANRKLYEAQASIVAGDMRGSIALLREAIKLDPTNAVAHRSLGDLLLQSGARREAIDEYSAATRISSGDTAAWRALASVQFAEGLYNEAAESFRRLLSETNETDPNNTIRLYYADSLRLAGRADEAREVYETLTASSSTEVASAAAQRLAELAALSPSEVEVSNNETAPAESGALNLPDLSQVPTPALPNLPPPVIAPTVEPPRPTPSASDPYSRGVQLWSRDRGAAVAEFRQAATSGNPDAYYYLGLSIAEGRDPQTLNRSELLSGLEYFQRARGGRFGASARRYEEQLGNEVDRRRGGG